MKAGRILLFLTRIPYPPIDGTRSKILNNVVKGLAARFDLDFLIVTDEVPQQSQINFLEEHFGRVTLFSFNRWYSVWKTTGALFSSLPLQVVYYFHKEVDSWLKSNIQKYDSVYVHGLRLGEYLHGLQGDKQGRLLIDLNDAMSLNYQEAKKFASPIWRFIYMVEEHRIRSYELGLLRKFKNFSIVSKNDQQYLKSKLDSSCPAHSNIQFGYIPHGVDSALLNYSPAFEKKIAFMGNLDYPPNRDAIKYLCGQVWPLLKAANPDVRLIVIGNGSNALKKKHRDICFTGFVEDPYQLLAECSVFVAPLRFGAGVPTKILEAMAIGLTVVTTPLGARGICGAESGVNLFILEQDQPVAWANLIRELLNNIPCVSRVGQQAKQLVRAEYSDVIAQEHFRNIFTDLVAHQAAPFCSQQRESVTSE